MDQQAADIPAVDSPVGDIPAVDIQVEDRLRVDLVEAVDSQVDQRVVDIPAEEAFLVELQSLIHKRYTHYTAYYCVN